jgi:hypothetical protein
MSNHSATCEVCDKIVAWEDADDYWTLNEAGWMCDVCEDEWYREGMAMAAQAVREQAAAQGGCPRCGSGLYDEHMICHACMVDDTNC